MCSPCYHNIHQYTIVLKEMKVTVCRIQTATIAPATASDMDARSIPMLIFYNYQIIIRNIYNTFIL